MNLSSANYQQQQQQGLQDVVAVSAQQQHPNFQQYQIGPNSSTVPNQGLYTLQYQQQQQQQQPQQKPQQQPFYNPQSAASNSQFQQLRAQQQNEQQRQKFVEPLDSSLANNKYWQQQVQLSQASAAANLPHSYARNAALSSRASQLQQNATIPLTVCDQAQQFAVQNFHSSSNASVGGTAGSTGAPGTPIKSGGASSTAFANLNQKKEQMEDERQRIINEEVNKQFWTALDCSGQGIPKLSPKLFNYNFLQKLFLCHNKLTSIPKSITKLNQLKILDVSNNLITEIPEELGVLYHLRFFFFFNNQVQKIPQKLGSLFQLDFLGIEGNPLDLETRTIMAKEGTKGLIQHLRDNAPRDIPRPKREWIVFDDKRQQSTRVLHSGKGDGILDLFHEPEQPEKEGDESSDNKDDIIKAEHLFPFKILDEEEAHLHFTVLSYNILCDTYATPQMYSYTPSWALDWSYRSSHLLQELIEYNPDVICLQELDRNSYDVMFKKELPRRGYKAEYLQKGRSKLSEDNEKKTDGCATFYKSDVFRLVERHDVEFSKVALDHAEFRKGKDTFNRFLNRDNVAMILVLEHIPSKKMIFLTNTHLHWDPAFKDVKVMQVVILLEELAKVINKYTSKNSAVGQQYPQLNELKQVPSIICGDFNSTVDSGVYHLLTQGKITNHVDIVGRQYGKYSSEGTTHDFSFMSAYKEIGELDFTNFTPNFIEAIDYIFFSTPSLEVKGLLGPMDKEYAKSNIAIPDAVHPSDHIPIMAEFKFKHLKERVKHPKPNYSSMTRKT